MNPRLIEALREAARRIESGEAEYQWSHPARCNCGVLAQCLLGVDEATITVAFWGSSSMWSRRERCDVTGLPADVILGRLADAGVSTDDVTALEWLSDRVIQKRAGLRPPSSAWFNKGSAVASYMLAWADMLEKAGGGVVEFEMKPDAVELVTAR